MDWSYSSAEKSPSVPKGLTIASPAQALRSAGLLHLTVSFPERDLFGQGLNGTVLRIAPADLRSKPHATCYPLHLAQATLRSENHKETKQNLRITPLITVPFGLATYTCPKEYPQRMPELFRELDCVVKVDERIKDLPGGFSYIVVKGMGSVRISGYEENEWVEFHMVFGKSRNPFTWRASTRLISQLEELLFREGMCEAGP